MIQFTNQTPYRFTKRRMITSFLKMLAAEEGKTLEALSIVICSKKYIKALNKRFLNHDYFTDILTFDLDNRSTINGEIYISIDTVKENSITYNVLIFNELLRVIIHGVLHLCGYKDNTSQQKRRMTLKENFYLNYFDKMFHVKQLQVK